MVKASMVVQKVLRMGAPLAVVFLPVLLYRSNGDLYPLLVLARVTALSFSSSSSFDGDINSDGEIPVPRPSLTSFPYLILLVGTTAVKSVTY